MNDPNIEYTKKNDMVVELQNAFVVVDGEQLKEMRSKYGEIKVIEEINERIKYSPGYYGFLYDEISDLDSLKEFSLNKEVIDNIFSDYFRNIYIDSVESVLNDNSMSIEEKMRNIVEYQLNFSLIPIDKQKYYREKYAENYFKDSYITKIKILLNGE